MADNITCQHMVVCMKPQADLTAGWDDLIVAIKSRIDAEDRELVLLFELNSCVTRLIWVAPHRRMLIKHAVRHGQEWNPRAKTDHMAIRPYVDTSDTNPSTRGEGICVRRSA